MAINGIPEVLNDYNAYLSGNRLDRNDQGLRHPRRVRDRDHWSLR